MLGRERYASPLRYYALNCFISLSFCPYPSPSLCFASFVLLPTDRRHPAFIYARGLSDEPRGVTMFVVKCNKSGRLQGTRGELTQLQPWRPWRLSADKALLIQMNRTPSEGDLSMCQWPTSQPQITCAGQALEICRKSSGLGEQHSEDPQ